MTTPSPIRRLRTLVGSAYADLKLPRRARDESRRDRRGLPAADPGLDAVERACLDWLRAAQDNSASRDGGFARDYSLVHGWATSYPETSGYIVPTLLAGAERRADRDLEARARRALDWLVSIQLPGGGFQGGTIGSTPVVPVTFNTGQILLGLADGVRRFGDAYAPAMHAAAQWLVDTQDDDGCWRRHATPFAKPGEKAYETHVSWGLYEAARASGNAAYADAATRNVRWALGAQHANGWFERCCLAEPEQPLTHTLGYVLRGIVEAYRYTNEPDLLAASRRTADGLLTALRPDGLLPGRLAKDWSGAVPWVCVTGSAQIAHCWLLLHQITGDARYRDAGFAALRFVRRTIDVDGPAETRGAVKGSFPVDGGYGRYSYLNWACKFTIDAVVLEREVRLGEA